MAIACDPSSLESAAKCFSCLTGKQLLAVQTYLLAVIAGLPTNLAGVQSLMSQAKCFSCLTPQQQVQVSAYLLCKIQGG